MPSVRITETYDLSTTVNKLGIIGIHTPSADQLLKMYPGLVRNYRKIALSGCDVTIACASMLPADPLQIGTEAGSIAPQDLFNPILYTAVSNDKMNTIQARIMAGTDIGLGSISTADINGDNFKIYYSLLADKDGWKKAMAQNGLQMTGLYPIVYEVLSNSGNPGAVTYNAIGQEVSTDADLGFNTTNKLLIRGNSKRMPAIPMHAFPNDPEAPGNLDAWFPTTYVACVIMPPAKLHKLYYRMTVTWTYEFIDLIPITEYAYLAELETVGASAYASDYAEQSGRMDTTTDTVDVAGATIEKVMVSTR